MNVKFNIATQMVYFVLQNQNMIDVLMTIAHLNDLKLQQCLMDIQSTPNEPDNVGYFRKTLMKLDDVLFDHVKTVLEDCGLLIVKNSNINVVGSNNTVIQISSNSVNIKIN